MRSMDWTESRQFLLQGTRTAKIATIGAEGGPHLVPVWFTVDQDDVVFSTFSRSVKARNMARDPRVAVAVDDDTDPFAFVSITGRAELVERPADFLAWATTIATRYVGPARGAELGRVFTEIDDLIVRVRMESFVGRAEIVG
ncbi:MAG: PPOX class F420-dependent oxidoreductase [Nakamurella sp.]